jgi:hypothetical protein
VGPRACLDTVVKRKIMDLQELGCEGVDWIKLRQDRVVVNTVIDLQVP